MVLIAAVLRIEGREEGETYGGPWRYVINQVRDAGVWDHGGSSGGQIPDPFCR